jgi:membrane protease YdiL (CAAX protease family)
MFWFGIYGGGPSGVFFHVLGVIPIAILLTAVFNLTGRSIPVAMLLHASINMTPVFMPASTIANGIWMLLMLIVAIWMWRCPQTFSSEQVENKYGGELEKTKAL